VVESIEAALMSNYEEARNESLALCLEAIDEACEVLLAESGVTVVLRFIAYLVHGEVVPAPVIYRLQQQAAKIHATKTA
jgi:hypothetical protein